MMGSLLLKLDLQEDLSPTLSRFGAHHAKLGIQWSHFLNMKRSLLHAMSHTLQGSPHWTAAHEHAWDKVFDAIASAMLKAIHDVQLHSFEERVTREHEVQEQATQHAGEQPQLEAVQEHE
jgi:hemoglobin-like flavoprotein